MSKGKKTIPMLPREPLTKKARAAIILYVKLRAKSYTSDVVDKTLQAERMSRAALYTYLNKRNYRWDSSRSQWRALKRKPAAPKQIPVAAKKNAVATTSKATPESTDIPSDIAQFIRDNAANIRSNR